MTDLQHRIGDVRVALVVPGQAHTARGDQGHLMPRERIAPQSEVIGAVVLADSPYCEIRGD